MSWHGLEPVDQSYFASAPYVYRFSYDLPVSVERVWASLTSENSVADWTPLLRRITWTSPRPFGVGTTREVVLPARALTLRERFFVWDDGRRFAFYATEASLPLLRHFAEDYLVEPTGSGSRFTWTFALEGTRRTRLLTRVIDPVNRLQFKTMSAGCKRYFASDAGA